MNLAMRMLVVAVLSLFSPACEAVRKQAGRFSPKPPSTGVRVRSYSISTALVPGMDGRLRALTREMRSSQVGEGEAAEVATIIEDCIDGDCEESRITSGPGADRRTEASDWVADAFRGDDVAGPGPVQFGLEELDGDGTRIFSHLGFDGFHPRGTIEWTDDVANPFIPKGSPSAPVDSVTRSVKVTERNGQRQRTEAVTRCHDSKCTSEVVQGEGSTAKVTKAKLENVAHAGASACVEPTMTDAERHSRHEHRMKMASDRLALGLYLGAIACATELGNSAIRPAWVDNVIHQAEGSVHRSAGKHAQITSADAALIDSDGWARAWHRDQAKEAANDAARALEMHEWNEMWAKHSHIHGF